MRLVTSCGALSIFTVVGYDPLVAGSVPFAKGYAPLAVESILLRGCYSFCNWLSPFVQGTAFRVTVCSVHVAGHAPYVIVYAPNNWLHPLDAGNAVSRSSLLPVDKQSRCLCNWFLPSFNCIFLQAFRIGHNRTGPRSGTLNDEYNII